MSCRLTLYGSFEEHLAAATGEHTIMASRGLIGAHQADLMAVSAGLD